MIDTARDPALDDLDRIRALVAEARDHLLSVVRAPWNRMTPYAMTSACEYLGHITKRPDDPPSAPCCCGWRT